MARFVALLRGINVGTAKRLAMADLRALLEALGHGCVRTLLNSGNAVFDAPAASAPPKLAARIQAALAERLRLDSFVIVKSAKSVAAMVAENRLAEGCENESRLIVAITQDSADLARLKALAHVDFGREKLQLGTEAAYLWCPDGILQSRAASTLLSELKDRGTTRNWATMTKIAALLNAA